MDQILAKVPPNIQPNAVIDGDIIAAFPSYATVMDPNDASVPAKSWLKALAVGDSAFDVRRPPALPFFPLSQQRNPQLTKALNRHPCSTGS